MKNKIQEESLKPSRHETESQPQSFRIWQYAAPLYRRLTRMATSSYPPSPSRQLLEADNSYGDDWMQAEDDELPTLISSIEHGKYLDRCLQDLYS